MIIPFRPIARLLLHALHTAPGVDLNAVQGDLEKLFQDGAGGGVLITVNHFSAPDFHAWWFVILISALFPADIYWVVTSGWTNSGWLTGFTHWLFPRGARLLGFTEMPAMPPNPAEVEQRAVAVRSVLRYARKTAHPVIGMAPEGGDQPGGVLGRLPPGAGRFVQLISQWCPIILPVGVWTEAGCIHLKFGSPYQLEIPVQSPAKERDTWVGEAILNHIAVLLPEYLRGEYR